MISASPATGNPFADESSYENGGRTSATNKAAPRFAESVLKSNKK